MKKCFNLWNLGYPILIEKMNVLNWEKNNEQ